MKSTHALAARAALLAFALASSLPAWTINAVPKGPNQVNLTWQAPPSAGYGYLVEIQSDSDPRYLAFSELKPVPNATGYTCDPTLNWRGNGTGCTISDPAGTYVYNPSVNGVPAWITESQYIDPQDGTRAQFIATGLRQGTRYNFRVRTYTGNTNPVYGAYSDTATATTSTYFVRYVSTTGNDDNDGTAPDDAHAWRTIGKAAGVACGTLVLVKGGDYADEFVFMGQACSALSKVVVQAADGETVRITTNAHPSWGSVLTLNGSSIVVDGIGVAENFQPDYVVTVRGSRNALFNMNIGPTAIPSAYGGVALQGSDALVYGNYIHDFGSPYYLQNGSGDGGFPLLVDWGATGNVVWSNHLTRGGHDCTLVHHGASNRFLNNIADGGWGMAFEVVFGGSQDNLFEGIVAVHQGALETNIYKPAFELSYKANTVRRSTFVHAGRAAEISAYDSVVNNLVYNNVFYDVGRCYFQSHNYGVSAYDGVMFQNNICRFTDKATEIYLANLTPKAISYNNLFKAGGDGSEASVVWAQDDGGSFQYPVTLAFAEANYGSGVFYRNSALSTAPAAFVDPVNMDFHLLLGSPLAGAGTTVVDPDWGFPFSSTVDLGVHGLQPATIKAAPVISLNSSLNPATPVQSVVLSAIVPAAATGTVQFLDGTTVLATATVAGGTATATALSFTAGTHNLTAAYSGDSNYSAAVSTALALNVVKADATVTLTASASPAIAGQPVTLTAKVPGTATGTIQFLDGATVLGTAVVWGGTAGLTVPSFTAATYSLTAAYSGDINYSATVSTALTLNVVKSAATVTLTASASPATAGQPVTLTAKVPSTATGTIQFLDGSTVLGTATVAGGTAVLTVPSFTAATHNLTAAYSGDSNYFAALSTALALNVAKAAATVTLTASASPATAGQPVTLTAKVPSTATGTIQFLDGATVLGTAVVSGGTAVLTVPSFTAATHNLTAAYSGDSNYSATVSTALALNVAKPAATVTLTSSANPVTAGLPVTLTAKVPSAATGTIQFFDGATVLRTAVVSGGTAMLTVPSFTAGTHNLTAAYGGDSNYSATVSTALTLNVAKPAATVTLSSSANPATAGQPVTLTAKVPSTATGTIQFLDGTTVLGTAVVSGGTAVLTVPSFTAATHNLTAAYSGDSNYSATVSPALALTAVKGAASVTITSSVNSATVGQIVILTASVTPTTATGLVQFLANGKTLGTAAFIKGTASLAVSNLTAGTYIINAVYGGNAYLSQAVSSALTLTVESGKTRGARN